jgi:peptide-methionine (S)-S-oxide reductase
VVTGNALVGPWPENIETFVVGMGCFWGAERKFWQQEGVYSTAVGYAAGHTPNPSYEEVCSGQTGHNEVVLVAFDTTVTSFAKMLQVFWESHNPTQGMRQGNDAGTQYRSGIYLNTPEQVAQAEASKGVYQGQLKAAGLGDITSEVLLSGPFFYAEEYHQQYLQKNPSGYCGIGGTGVSCPIGVLEAG